MNFLDSSAVVKLARHEAETEALRGWIAANPYPIVVSALARTECAHLRSLDAIHLATAETLAGSLHAFVAYDKRLADVARLRGLPVAVPS